MTAIKQQRQFGHYLPGVEYRRGGVRIKLTGDTPVDVFTNGLVGEDLFTKLPESKETYFDDNHIYRCVDERTKRLSKLLTYGEMCFIDSHYDVCVMGKPCIDIFVKLLDTVGESRFRVYAWSLYDLIEDIILCTLEDSAYVETTETGIKYVGPSNLPILFTNEVVEQLVPYDRISLLSMGEMIDSHINLYRECPDVLLIGGLSIRFELKDTEEGYLIFELVNHL